MNKLLDDATFIIDKLAGKVVDIGITFGNLKLSIDDIAPITNLDKNNLIEIFQNDDRSIDIEDLNKNVGFNLKLEVKTGDIRNYFETKKDFVNANKLSIKNTIFYIAEIKYRSEIESNAFIDAFRKNIEFISFLRNIADTEKVSGSSLELFFYKSGNGINLLIDYDISDLINFEINGIESFKVAIEEQISGEDKKQLFINELISFIGKGNQSYISLRNSWEILFANYSKSYSLFLAGFSFEKIKTSSNEHFQKLVDKISESIGKASTYIFGVPVGYILLLNGFDFTGLQIGKNFVLLLLGAIFLILIWRILFTNISETIQIIEIEIDDFIKKIETVNVLSEIKEKLEVLKMKDLKSQRKKLNLVKTLSALIFIIICIVYIYTFINTSVFYL